MLNPNKKYKYGQLITIDNKVCRIQKNTLKFSSCCFNCEIGKCIGMSKCRTLFPSEAYLVRINMWKNK